MADSDQGGFNPSAFDPAVPATWPRPIGGGPYFAGQFWTITAPGQIDIPVSTGDRVYVTSLGRSYGQLNYGDAYVGWNVSGPWADGEVAFRAWAATAPPWDRPSSPFSGCPFGPRAPGWRTVIEALLLPSTSVTRTYGSLNYGDQSYGDGDPGYLSGAVGTASTPDTPDLMFTGPVRYTVVFDVPPGATAERTFAAQRASGASNLGWSLLYPATGGAVRFNRSVNGTTFGNIAVGTVPDSTARRTLSFDWNPVAATASFFAYLDGVPIGTQHDVAAGFFDSTAAVTIGRRTAGTGGLAPFAGRIYSFTIQTLAAMGGPVTGTVLRFDASEVPAAVASAGGNWTDPRGRVWTLTAGAVTPFIPRDSGATEWVDVTPKNYGVTIRRGNPDGNPVVAVDQAQLDFLDLDASLFAMAQPESWYAPRVGTRIRVGLLAPTLAYHPLFSGRIEQITDEHDVPPRIVEVDAFGSVFDLAVDKLQWTRPAETALVRTQALLAASGYDWAPPLNYPPPTALIADPEPRDITVREELDRTALSVGQMLDSAPNGALRFRNWPDPGVDPVVEVADCRPGLLAAALLVADMDELLNAVLLSNADKVTAEVTDPVSIDYFGRRTEGLGAPFTELATVAAALPALAASILAVYQRTSNRVESIEADIAQDPAWFAVLVSLDLGRRLRFTRRAFLPDHPLVLDAVVAGFEYRLTPNQWTSTINTTTRTPSI